MGELKELFPDDLPGEMTITYGRWEGNVPGEIRMRVVANIVVKNYDLPTLKWNKETRRYLPVEK